jgi:hypothetical protein
MLGTVFAEFFLVGLVAEGNAGTSEITTFTSKY